MTFYELERECKKRKIRVFIIIIFLILLLIGGVYLYMSLHKQKISKKPEIKKITNNTKEINTTVKNIKNKPKKPIKLLPVIDLNISFDMNNSKVAYVKKETQTKKSNNNQSVILNSQIMPSFDTCIHLAKKYFDEKDYENALKWAKLANTQDKKNPISWIISAKALYKMGKKEKAIKLLKIYNSYYNNKDIKKLIKEFNAN